MQHNILKVHEEFQEIDTKTIDDRKRVTLGSLINDAKRVRLYKNKRGEILLIPIVEIPASELWLYQNREALTSIKKGLQEAARGRISKINPNEL